MGVQSREPARDPQDLERLLIVRQHAGDVEGMVALFEPDAVIDTAEGDNAEGRLIRGHNVIAGLDPAIWCRRREMPGSRPGMTSFGNYPSTGI
jgi:hypothetical protein